MNAINASVEPARVPGVEYSTNPLMPGVAVFRCTRMSATLQVASCRQMWTQANEGGSPPERLFQCRSCPVGAGHAGVQDPAGHVMRGLGVCSRCQRTDLRLIGGNVCVGCKNREYEWVKGCNAKGKFPVCHPAMHRRRVNVCAGGVARVVARDLTVSTVELVVEALRDSPTRVVFGLGRIQHAK